MGARFRRLRQLLGEFLSAAHGCSDIEHPNVGYDDHGNAAQGPGSSTGGDANADPKDNAAKILVFVLYKKEARDVARSLSEQGVAAEAIHGDLSQSARRSVLEQFRSGKVAVLVATDVAARGLDVAGITHVVNFSLGMSIETYVHRIGRCGRAGNAGTAVTFVVDGDEHLVPALVSVLADSNQPVPESLNELVARAARVDAAARDRAELRGGEAEVLSSLHLAARFLFFRPTCAWRAPRQSLRMIAGK